SVFECSNGALRFVRRHWDIATKFHGAGPPPPSVGDTARSLVEAMDAISAAYPHPLVDLTGGYDSRLVFAAMLETGRPFTAIVNGPANSRDVMVAKSVASAFAVPLLHGERPDLAADEAWSRAAATIPLTDGEFDALLYFNTMQVHRSSAERFSASVNGSNGEITKGYWYELLFPHTGRTGHFDPRRIAAKRFVFDLEPSPILAARFDLSLVDEFAAFLDAANRDIIHLPNTALLDNAYLSLRMQYWQGRIASSTLRIWPVTSPFFFRRPMELAMATPGTVRLRLGLTTRLIEALNPRLAAMPLEHGYPAQPIRPSNAHRFVVPLIQEYWPKVRQRLPFPPARVHGAPELSLPARLATLPAVRSLLDFDSMASATLYNPDVFRPWLQACLTPGAPSSLHRLGRVLTIELAARAAARFHS
ncbi:MAG: hypothetical protein HZB13_12005, partial [Acidobacteria bacterium]|nr:hypothetical protein [Acidobacteriota bacterium]